MEKLNSTPIATLLVPLAFVIVVVAGAIVTIVNPDALTFEDYVQAVGVVAGALGLLAIGRGINLNGEKRAQADALALAHEAGMTYEDPDLPPEPAPEDVS